MALLVVACCATSCRHKKVKSAVAPPVSVEVAVAQEMLMQDQIEVSSQVASLHEAIIQPRVNGFLRSINYREGMPVKRGDLLFEIDPSQYSIALLAAQAEVESAVAQEALARSNYERAKPLVAIDAISRSDMDQYTATHKSAQASVRSASEALSNAELNLSYTKILSPINGLAAESPATVGDYVGAGTSLSTLTTISYIDTVEVEIPIPTAIYLQHVAANGQQGSEDNAALLSDITLTRSGGRLYEHMGEYDYTLTDSPSRSSTVVVVAKFPNPDLILKAGMFARITAGIGSLQPRVVVPQKAVSQSQGVNTVWVIKPDSVAELRQVVLGSTSGENWIIDQGVSSGESVVVSGQLKVHNGAKVSPTKQ